MTLSAVSTTRDQEIIDRNQEIIELREQKMTLQEIGEIHGITRERVRQILLLNGIGSPTKKQRDKAISKLKLSNELSVSQISKLTGIGEARIHHLMFLDQFPKSKKKVLSPFGSAFCVWDKDEVMNWCEERFETIQHVLTEKISQRTLKKTKKLGLLIIGANPATNKRTKKWFDQLIFLSSKPFSAGHWKGQLVFKQSKWVGAS